MAPNTVEIIKTLLRNGMILTASTDSQAKSGLKAVYFDLNGTTITAETAATLLLMRSSPGYQEPT